jgi:hypothetical protein
MPNLETWIGYPAASDYLSDSPVYYKEIVVTNLRSGLLMTLRLETWLSRRLPIQTEGGVTSMADGLIFLIEPINLVRGDRFVAEGRAYEVISVLPGFVGQTLRQAFVTVKD